MDALTLLHERNSAPKLCEPGPSGKVLSDILKSALRSPDHARIKPWRFLTVEAGARESLGTLFVESAKAAAISNNSPPPSESELEKISRQPLRAPLVIIVIAAIKEHPKVPPIEQILSAGCAAHSILLAAHALGYAGVWRTGIHAYDQRVKSGLGLAPAEAIVGFIYLGTIDGNYKSLAELPVEDYCESWNGPIDK